jgi:Tfp pilus assembly protein PilV
MSRPKDQCSRFNAQCSMANTPYSPHPTSHFPIPNPQSLIPPPRSGVVLVVVIVCLVVAMAVFMSVVKLATAQRQTIKTQQWQAQAAWLAEAGLERAAARLATDPSYTGETWTIAGDQLGGPDGAAVAIRLEAVPGEPNRRLVRVQADYPDDPRDRARQEKQIVMQIPKGKEP